MREILFRGKTKDGGKWVEGDLLHDKIGTFICWLAPDGAYAEAQVIPETVGQYTGLVDKNGKRIFEGDILPIWENGEEYYYKVVYVGDCFMLAMLDSEQGSYPLSAKHQQTKVIGNIHDNPELMEER